jgi:hypothetical protein
MKLCSCRRWCSRHVHIKEAKLMQHPQMTDSLQHLYHIFICGASEDHRRLNAPAVCCSLSFGACIWQQFGVSDGSSLALSLLGLVFGNSLESRMARVLPSLYWGLYLATVWSLGWLESCSLSFGACIWQQFGVSDGSSLDKLVSRHKLQK